MEFISFHCLVLCSFFTLVSNEGTYHDFSVFCFRYSVYSKVSDGGVATPSAFSDDATATGIIEGDCGSPGLAP